MPLLPSVKSREVKYVHCNSAVMDLSSSTTLVNVVICEEGNSALSNNEPRVSLIHFCFFLACCNNFFISETCTLSVIARTMPICSGRGLMFLHLKSLTLEITT